MSDSGFLLLLHRAFITNFCILCIFKTLALSAAGTRIYGRKFYILICRRVCKTFLFWPKLNKTLLLLHYMEPLFFWALTLKTYLNVYPRHGEDFINKKRSLTVCRSQSCTTIKLLSVLSDDFKIYYIGVLRQLHKTNVSKKYNTGHFESHFEPTFSRRHLNDSTKPHGQLGRLYYNFSEFYYKQKGLSFRSSFTWSIVITYGDNNKHK